MLQGVTGGGGAGGYQSLIALNIDTFDSVKTESALKNE
jgi:hypothetical protein